MARVLIPEHKQWYHELKSVHSYREEELERFVIQQAPSLFHDFYVFPFKIEISAKDGSGPKKPDLAMIRKDLREWGVIEVELEGHPIAHVIEQVSIFTEGTYNTARIPEYIFEQATKHCNAPVTLPAIKKLCMEVAPRVVVLVDSDSRDWESTLTKHGVELCTFEIYKDGRGLYVFRALGKYPVVEEAHAILKYDKPSNSWQISTQFNLVGKNQPQAVDIKFNDSLTRWALFKVKQHSYLKHLGQFDPLSPNSHYAIFRDTTGVLHFRII